MTDPLEAGRELDALVAEKVMGWTEVGMSNDERSVWKEAAPLPIGYPPTPPARTYQIPIPHFSSEIAAAWTVVDRLFELGWQVEIWCEAPNTLGIPKWHVMLKPFGAPLKWKTVGRTAPEAICRAALRAVLPEDPPMRRLPIGEPGQFIKVKP